jgi:uncharacterized protein (TIGR00369 family)
MTRTEQHRSPLADKLGIRLLDAGAGEARYAMPFDLANTTVADVVHGGAILALADVAATGAVWSVVDDPERHRGITIELSLSFISAARGCGLIGHGRLLRRGGSVCFAEVDVLAEPGGERVARAQVTYKLSKVETPAEVLTRLFSGKSVADQLRLLEQLEHAGAGLYQSFALDCEDPDARERLLEAARRELENAATLHELL